jgi:hypothetical protein
MGRKTKAASQKQSILIPLRVNIAEYQVAEQAAKKAHLPVATFARVALLKASE